MVDRESKLIELTSPDDLDDSSYPSEPSVAGDLMRHLADQILAARYVDDETLYRIWGSCEDHDIPPIVRRYVELRRCGTPPARMRVNGKKLVKYSTTKSDHLIEINLANASETADRIPGKLAQAKRELAAAFKISVATVQRRWSNVKSEKKRGPGRPRKIGEK